jgi:pimeloyl-ACP methyl ester carboxylesterase
MRNRRQNTTAASIKPIDYKFAPLGLWSGLVHEPGRAERFEVQSEDGLRLCLRRVRAFGRVDAVAGVERPAVMLLHGLAANHRGLHFRGRSLAEWLAARGFDVWLPELRGHGDSESHGWDWRLDDYLRYDLPAILDAILAHSGREKVHWVGHSMGGILLMCYGILHPDAPIGRAVTIASALDYKVGSTGFAHLLKIRGVIEKLGVIPYRGAMRLLAPAIGRGIRVLETFNAWSSNMDGQIHREVYANCFHNIPTSLLASLATTFEPEGLRLDDGYCFLKNAADFAFPLRMLAGSRDAQVSAAAVEHTAELLGENAHALVMGPDSAGALRTEDHYGHWDLLVGRRAPQETWPAIAEWLEND